MKKVIRLTESDIAKIVKKVILEQTSSSKSDVKGYNELAKAVQGLGTNEKQVLDVFTNIIKTKSDFDNLNSELQKKPWTGQNWGGGSYSSILDVLNGELQVGDYETAKAIQSALAKIGVNITFVGVKDSGHPERGFVSVKSDSFKMGTGTPNKTTENVVDIVGKYIGGVKKSSVSGVEAAFRQFPKSRVYYIIDPKTNAKRYFQYNVDGTKLTKRGTWSIENDKIVYDKVNTPTNTSTETPPPPQNRRQYTQAPDSADVMNGSTTLKQYQMGPLVGRIQRLLGFPTTDDKFGPKTLVALVSFQDKNGITDERGFVGPKTLTALERISQPIQLASKGLKNILPTQDNQTPVLAQNKDLGVDDFS